MVAGAIADASSSGRGADAGTSGSALEDNFFVAKSDDELRRIVAKAAGRLVVVSFGSAWCKKCSEMSSPFVSLSLEYADPVFVSADVNDLPQYGAKIRYIPTFAFFSARGQKVDEITGTSVQSLRDHLWLQMEAGGR